MWKHVRNIVLIVIVLAIAGIWYITRPDVAQLSLDAVTGASPEITAPRPQGRMRIRTSPSTTATPVFLRWRTTP